MTDARGVFFARRGRYLGVFCCAYHKTVERGRRAEERHHHYRCCCAVVVGPELRRLLYMCHPASRADARESRMSRSESAIRDGVACLPRGANA